MTWPNPKPFFTWLRSVYSESDGTGSSTRLHVGLIIGFIVGVGLSLAVSVHHGHITVEQFDGFLSAGGMFIMTCCGALYGINRLADWAETKTQKPPQADR